MAFLEKHLDFRVHQALYDRILKQISKHPERFEDKMSIYIRAALHNFTKQLEDKEKESEK